MGALSDYAEDLALDFLLTTESVTRPTAWYVALHTGDPGEDGSANEVTTTDDSDYVRKAVTFAASSGGQTANDVAVSWTVNASSSGFTITHASIKDALTGGNTLQKGELLVAKALVASGVQTFNIGEIVAKAD